MSSDRRSTLKRTRKISQEEDFLDITDDFQDAATLFRLPKRLMVSKSQDKLKKNNVNRDTQKGSLSSTRTVSSKIDSNVTQPDSSLVQSESKTPVNDSDLQEIEKSLCCESEKLCPSCKMIVLSNMFAEHFKECMQRYRLTKEECMKQFPVSGRESKSTEQQKQQPLLPCPVCKKTLKSRTQRVSHIKMCAQENGLTSEQLLLASNLLQKQSEEWEEIGLPSSLHLHNTGPKTRNSKNRDIMDPDIAMALALSRSIVERKMESRLSREEKLIALGLEDIVEEERNASPILLPPPASATRSRLKRSGKDHRERFQFHKSVLATRSMEERERLISEKVAVMLTSEDTVRGGWQHADTKEKSGKLSSVTSKKCQLWEIARGSENEPLHSFYVPELEQFIKPKETTIGSLLRSLSQVPGRLNATAVHALNEESESEGEMEESATIEEFGTQMALAGLLESQEDLDIITEAEWEQAAEGMQSQGFIRPTPIPKVHSLSDGRSCSLSKTNVDIMDVMGRNPAELMEVCISEKDCVILIEKGNKKNKDDNSLSTEGSTESLISSQPIFTEAFDLNEGSSHSEILNFDSTVNSEKKTEPQIVQQFIDIHPNQSKCNNEATIKKISYSITHVNDSIDKCEDIEKLGENNSLLSLQYGKEGIYSSLTRLSYHCEENLATSGMVSNNYNVMFLPGGKSSSSLATDLVLEDKSINRSSKEEAVPENQISDFASDCMINTLIKNWNDLLKSGVGSDVSITSLEGSSVQVHSLVLMARCPKLYKESKAQGKLNWCKVPQKAVNHFLSYLYTGSCELSMPGDPLWTELYDIGLQYECKDLVSYMEHLCKGKGSPLKIRTLHPEKDEDPLPIEIDHEESVKITEKTQAVSLTEDSRAERNLCVKNDLIACIPVTTDEYDLEQSERIQDSFKSGNENQDKMQIPECGQRAQSPDLFDDTLCAEKSFAISVVNSPPLIVIPHHPMKDNDQLEQKELKEVSNVLPKASSPCKLVSCYGAEVIESSPSCPPIPILHSGSKRKLLVDPDCIQDVRSVDTKSKAKSPVLPTYDKCKFGDDNVINLMQSRLNFHSEECVLDLPDISSCQTETDKHDYADKMGIKDDGNYELLKCTIDNAHQHYSSNVWNDFDVEYSMPVTEELQCTFDKLTGCSKNKSINGTELNLLIPAHSTSDKVGATFSSSIEDHQKGRCCDKLKPTNPQEGKTLMSKTNFSASPQASGGSSFVEFFDRHSSDEILANEATGFEETDAVCQSKKQAEWISLTHARASYLLTLTPQQNSNAGKKIVTPKPDYSSMKSPELKKELHKYGICSLGRKKAVAILQHVYEETHPLVTDSEAESSFSTTPVRNSVMTVGEGGLKKNWVNRNGRYGSSLNLQRSSKANLMEKEVGNNCSATDESERNLEEGEDDQLHSSVTSSSSLEGSNEGTFGEVAPPDEDEKIISSTQQAGLVNQVQEIIMSRTDIYKKVLLYEPIFVEDLNGILKANKIKCSMQALMDALDELCIIVRTQANQKRSQRKSSKTRRNFTEKKAK